MGPPEGKSGTLRPASGPRVNAEEEGASTLGAPDSVRVVERLVYLSSEAEEALDELEPGTAYVIGGLVYRNRHKGLTHQRARAAGVPTLRLPLEEHVEMAQRRVLAVNHVYEMLLLRAAGHGWPDAIMRVLPPRRGATLAK